MQARYWALPPSCPGTGSVSTIGVPLDRHSAVVTPPGLVTISELTSASSCPRSVNGMARTRPVGSGWAVSSARSLVFRPARTTTVTRGQARQMPWASLTTGPQTNSVPPLNNTMGLSGGRSQSA